MIGQTAIVGVWIIINAAVLVLRWDPYPFILLNLMFSLQAAYAAPLILLAQTRQADRDKALSDADTSHRQQLAAAALQRQETADVAFLSLQALREANTELTKKMERLTVQIHARVVTDPVV